MNSYIKIPDNIYIVILILFCVPSLSFSNSPVKYEQGHFVSLGTASTKGVYWPVGTGLCKLINAREIKNSPRCAVQITGGSTYNIKAVQSRELDLAITRLDVAQEAHEGSGTFSDWEPFSDLRILTGLYSQPVTIVVKRNSSIMRIAQIKGKRIGISKGSGQSGHVKLILKAMAAELSEVSLINTQTAAAMSDKFCEGKIDVLIQAIAHPSDYYSELLENCDARFLSLDKKEIQNVKTHNKFTEGSKISLKAYKNQSGIFSTYSHQAILITTKFLPERTGQAVIDSITENFEQFFSIHPALSPFEPEQLLLRTTSVPIHRGARDFQDILQSLGE